MKIRKLKDKKWWTEVREVAFAFLFWVRARLVWQEKTFRQYREINTRNS